LNRLHSLERELEDIEARVSRMQALAAAPDAPDVAALRRRARLLGEALGELPDASLSMQVMRSVRLIRKRLKTVVERLPND
jgi:hypothetical protein